MADYEKHTSKLWSKRYGDSSYVNWYFQCPACGERHGYRVGQPPQDQKNLAMWSFDGNVNEPTFVPSLRYLSGSKCHLTITKGIIEFHGDSPKLAGQKVPMIDIVPYSFEDK